MNTNLLNIIIGIVILLVGLPLYLWFNHGIKTKKRILESSMWPSVKGVITTSELVSQELPEPNLIGQSVEYSCNVLMTYTISGNTYKRYLYSESLTRPTGATRYEPARVSQTRILSRVQSIIDRYPVGKELLVHYNPKNPNDHVFNQTYKFSDKVLLYVPLILLSLLLMSSAALIVGGIEICPAIFPVIFFTVFAFPFTFYILNLLQGKDTVLVPAVFECAGANQILSNNSVEKTMNKSDCVLRYEFNGEAFQKTITSESNSSYTRLQTRMKRYLNKPGNFIRINEMNPEIVYNPLFSNEKKQVVIDWVIFSAFSITFLLISVIVFAWLSSLKIDPSYESTLYFNNQFKPRYINYYCRKDELAHLDNSFLTNPSINWKLVRQYIDRTKHLEWFGVETTIRRYMRDSLQYDDEKIDNLYSSIIDKDMEKILGMKLKDHIKMNVERVDK